MNLQKPTPPNYDASGILDLHSIFQTIQGEGVFSGQSAVFVRLAGCNLRCPGCDTEYTNGQKKVRSQYIVDEVNKVVRGNRLVVITGGEPFRQNLQPLVLELVKRGYTVQIETNGTLPPSYDVSMFTRQQVVVMCSPKTGRVHPSLLGVVGAFKYVLEADHIHPTTGLPTRVLGLDAGSVALPFDSVPVFVQPMDSGDKIQNLRNLQACINSVHRFGYTLGLQLHKIINVE